MLFNSYIFIFAFLPTVLGVFYVLPRDDIRWRIYWLVLASFFFYGWWSPPYILLLALFTVANFVFGRLIERTGRKFWLVIGICFNLSLILYYKYFYFLISQFLSGPQIEELFPWASPLLPLGISFFTFQKIAYLVDTYQKKVMRHTFGEYALFVTFFPQLIAGPIVHQKEILGQFVRFARPARLRWFALGLIIFVAGLAKKTILADPLGNIAAPLFDQSLAGPVSFAEAWMAALSYTLQLYFDFSGYSDMAIGLALLFGVKLPLNFFSPYKAANIIGFWRRWHMTLSRFLRDYVYIPLGGGRHGPARRYINLMATMLLGGLWHGAGWTFVLWGGLHGLFLCVNHLWQAMGFRMPRTLGWLVTFTAVVFAWVLFRAESMDSALRIWSAMLSPSADIPSNWHGALLIAGGLVIALTLPNIHQWVRGRWRWKTLPLIGRVQFSAFQGLAVGGLLWLCLLLVQFVQAEFLYFNF